ncbi:retinol dehydrogenase 16-like isoform X2 [Capricornis sumatraensis]|uniref:retinol dehydrogenase 16-like isoform X2 n=1 Tax=Capricornis sumatraensis TaxID=34865 RepID=UPI003604A8D6
MSDGAGGRAAEEPDIRQAGDGDPGRHQDREHRCGHRVGEGACRGQRRELSYFGVKVAIIEPGYFLTNMTQDEAFHENLRTAWNRSSPEIQELYGDNYLPDLMKMSDFLKAPWAGNLSLVTNCMEHALTACHPRSRYSAGWDAKFLYLPMSYMPSFLVDLMMYWNYPKPAKAL